jgi:3-methyladenine DNA glycosylase/8-oxoguanine DNA glycosylase
MDGLARRRGGVWLRLIHVGDEAVEVRAAQPSPDRLVLGARSLDRAAAEHGLGRLRFTLGADDDLREFYERFRDDELIGASVRRRPWLRARRRPQPFEALAWAVTEQLIEYRRAVEIQRRLVWRYGRPGPSWAFAGLRDAPSPQAIAALAPAELQALDLSAARAVALIHAAREVATGRVDLDDPAHERGWARLRAIPGIGAWTVEVLALLGQGRVDQVPAGDLGFLKVVGRMGAHDPRSRATENEVRELMARYDPWAGLAGMHLLVGAAGGAPTPLAA